MKNEFFTDDYVNDDDIDAFISGLEDIVKHFV